VHWLRHAIAAATFLTAGDHPDEDSADRLSAVALLNGLEHFADSDEWSKITLRDVARHSALRGRLDDDLCTCPQPFSRKDW